MMAVSLIPYPKELNWHTGQVHLSAGSRPPSLEIARQLRHSFTDDCLGNTEVFGLPISIKSISSVNGTSPEAYEIRVSLQGAALFAETAVGRAHALHTLSQLLWNFLPEGYLPCLTIQDWPSLPLRGVHVCYHLVTEFMPDLAPNLAELRRRIELMRHYKCNQLLLEIEAMFPYEGHPLLPAQVAFTRDQLREIAALCREQQVEIVPLVQCLGHAYNVLRFPEYAHLREVSGTTQQYCPTNPDVRDFYLELVDEIREVFPNLRGFHVGGDESRRLGICPRCKERADQIGVAGLYGEYIGAVCRDILNRGLTPYLWADIIEHWPDADWARYLPEGVVLVYWNYDILNWSREPAFDIMESIGRTTITASGARFGTHNHTMFLYSNAMDNIGILTRETERRGLSGTIVTDWTKATPHELSTLSLAYGMAEAWGGRGTSTDFEEDFGRLYFGLDGTAAAKVSGVYRLLEPVLPFCEDGQTHMLDRLDRYDLSGLTMRERIARYASQEASADTMNQLRAGLQRGRRALVVTEELLARCTANRREMGLLRLSAQTQIHKCRMGIAFVECARLLRYPTPGDAVDKERLVVELEELIDEWSVLAEETRRLLLPGTFPEVVEQAVAVKFEPDAETHMQNFLLRLKNGQTGVRLF